MQNPVNNLISADELARHLDDAEWAVVDCRFSLDDTGRGRREYLRSHIAQAVYAHLNEDLSAPIVPGKTGRHPLPGVDELARTLSAWGIDGRVQVVVYDDAGGAIAARLWWMLRWLGHDAVAVLDGGWPAWQDAGHHLSEGLEARSPRTFEPHPRPELLVSTEEVMARLADPTWRLVDSRVPRRYRGEVEPIDPVAGRIPGAANAPHPLNVGPDGLYLSAGALRARFKDVLGDIPPERTVFYCGSGVTAARNLLAFAHAGLGDARFYAGSWSEWITDPERPVTTG